MPGNLPHPNSSRPGQKVSIPFHFIRDLNDVYHSVIFSLEDASRQAYDILQSVPGSQVFAHTR